MKLQEIEHSILSSDIQRLENELAAALQRKAALDSEVENIHNTNSPPPEHSGTIAVLPVELLVEILYPVVAENPMHIRRLMLVSCFWRQMIESTPILWSAIRILVPKNLAMVEKCVAYCATCIERSAQCPLDISIDYSYVDISSLSFGDLILEAERRILGTVVTPERNWMEGLGRRGGPLENHGSHRYLVPLHILSGAANNFKTMERWRSFEFMGGQIIKSLLGSNCFRGSTPILERLRIGQNYSFWPSCYLGKSRPQPFPHTPRLLDLSLFNIAMSYNFQDIDPLKIERLDLQIHDEDQMKFVVRCRNLLSLRIGIPPPKSYFNFGWKPQFETLPFPQLRHLTICEWLPSWFYQAFAAPLLETIVYLTDYETRKLPALLKNGYVRRVELRWSYLHIDDWYTILKHSLGLLILTESVTTIVLHNTDSTRTEQVLKDLKGTGEYPMSGKTLLFMSIKYGPEPGSIVSVPLTEAFVDSIV